MAKRMIFIASILGLAVIASISILGNQKELNTSEQSPSIARGSRSDLEHREPGSSVLVGSEWDETPMTIAERARALMSTAVFKSFAATLDIAQQDIVAQILALYQANELTIQIQIGTEGQRLRMRTQLLQDTLAQLRARLPEPAWGMFLRSGLIPELDNARETSTQQTAGIQSDH